MDHNSQSAQSRIYGLINRVVLTIRQASSAIRFCVGNNAKKFENVWFWRDGLADAR
jgi:hypothetical protein